MAERRKTKPMAGPKSRIDFNNTAAVQVAAARLLAAVMLHGSIRQAAAYADMGIDQAYDVARTPEYADQLAKAAETIGTESLQTRRLAVEELMILARSPEMDLDVRIDILKFLVLEVAPVLKSGDSGNQLTINIGVPSPEQFESMSTRVIDATTPAELLPHS